MLRNTLAVLALALTVSSANAAVIGTATLVKSPPGTPFGAPDAALPSPWVAYQIGLSANAGETIGAVDVTVNGNKLHQRWNDTDFDGITNPSPQSPTVADGRGDSHLTAPAGSPFGAGPTETNTLAGSPLPSTPGVTEYGVGNLSGAWAILAPSGTANLAYLVFRSDDIPNLQIAVKAAQPSGAAILAPGGGDTFTAADFFVPEPASVSLIGLAIAGCLGFIRRR